MASVGCGRTTVTKLSMRLLTHQVDRLAFGTVGALRMYEGYAGADALRDRAELFEALPAPCGCLSEAEAEDAHRDQVVFVGAFVERKGVHETMRAWDIVRARLPMPPCRSSDKGASLGRS